MPAMHPLTRAVVELANQAEMSQFRNKQKIMRLCSQHNASNNDSKLPYYSEMVTCCREALETTKIAEIRRLAYAQMTDDQEETGLITREKLDGNRTLSLDQYYDEFGSRESMSISLLWKRWNPEYVALEQGMAVFLNQLSVKQQEAIRLVFFDQGFRKVRWKKFGLLLSDAGEVSKQLGIDGKSLRTRVDRGLFFVRSALVKQFLPTKEEDEDVPVAPAPGTD